MKDAMRAAAEILPAKSRAPNKPWISQSTLQLIGSRREARADNDYVKERHLHKAIRKAAKVDRGRWMDSLLQDGDWNEIRKLRRPASVRGGCLRDETGQRTESTAWAETMAKHLEDVQWRVRPAALVDGPMLGPELPVKLETFSNVEVKETIDKLKKKRASGPDDVPAEYWQAVADTTDGLSWLTRLCNECWNDECLPQEWHLSNVTAIHKKGDVENCDNYRPISSVCVAYKLFATLLLARLKSAGAEGRLTHTQFGFRSGRGTNDAIFQVRRRIDLALAQKHGCIGLLALDWKKCFDSINVEGLLHALERFGLPPKFVRIISHIYTDRSFQVLGAGSKSTVRSQKCGISQGCPMSPFLFVILMSVVTQDAVDLPAQSRK